MSTKNIIKNKALIESFISLSFLKIINLATPFLVLPFAVNSLGIESYGRISLILAINTYFLAVTGYGFSLSSTRDISKYRNSKIKISYIYSITILTKIYLYLFSLVIIVCMGFFSDYFTYTELALLLFILFSQTFFPDWYFKGLEKMKFIAIFDLFSKLTFLFSVIYFINNENDGDVYLFLSGFCQFSVTIISNIYIIRRAKFDLFWISLARVRKELTRNLPLFLNQFLPNLYSNLSIILIGTILGEKEAGVFSILRQVVTLYSVFNSVLSMTFFPYLNKNKGMFINVAKIYLFSSSVFMIMMILGGGFLDYFFDVNTQEIKTSYIIMILGTFMISLYSLFATNFLITHKKDKEVTLVTSIASLTGLLISYPLIYSFEIVGGAISISISQTIMALGSIYYARYYSNNMRIKINEK